MQDWITENRESILLWLFVGSIVSLALVAAILPLVVVRLPADYFSRNPARRPAAPRTPSRFVWRIGKNLVGALFVLAGFAMLFLPGQGVLTIVIGVLLLDFPGKYRLERWLVSRRGVLGAINRVRAKFDKPPLEVDSGE